MLKVCMGPGCRGKGRPYFCSARCEEKYEAINSPAINAINTGDKAINKEADRAINVTDSAINGKDAVSPSSEGDGERDGVLGGVHGGDVEEPGRAGLEVVGLRTSIRPGHHDHVPGRTANRRSRADYNEYMRGYMREYRKKEAR